MADIFSKGKRSEIMSLVKSKNTKPEVQLRKALHALGFRFSLHNKNLPGSPDIKLTRFKTVIFVNGCFWHGHEGCSHYTVPQNNNEYWVSKIKGNILRDKRNREALISLGWNIITAWTCNLTKRNIESTVEDIRYRLINSLT
ncbi:MAG: very short patch repair endonuclease [Mucilaginibacter sp.]|uniref:very short patch repair endonuclease n=1 Tax=Mucilaginibacter sp. TaxID=1882438 RepID=UPI003266D06E